MRRESRRQRLLRWLREQAKAQIILPVIIGFGLLAYVASVAAAPRSGDQIWNIVRQTWLLILLLTIPYLGARALVWHELLQQLGIDVPWRQLGVAFAGGEITKSLPAGVYTQNYLLGRLAHFSRHSIVRSSTATTAMLGLETALAVPAALIIGIPGAPWLRPLLGALVVAWIVVLILGWMVVHRWVVDEDSRKRPLLRTLAGVVDEFLTAGRELVAWCTVRSLVPTALYMLIYVVDLYAIMGAASVDSVSFVHTIAIYAVVVLAVVMVPIPTELGVTEFTGFGALTAYGVPGATAAIVMLGMRLLATGMTIVVAGVLLFLMRDELRTVEAVGEGAA